MTKLENAPNRSRWRIVADLFNQGLDVSDIMRATGGNEYLIRGLLCTAMEKDGLRDEFMSKLAFLPEPDFGQLRSVVALVRQGWSDEDIASSLRRKSTVLDNAASEVRVLRGYAVANGFLPVNWRGRYRPLGQGVGLSRETRHAVSRAVASAVYGSENFLSEFEDEAADAEWDYSAEEK